MERFCRKIKQLKLENAKQKAYTDILLESCPNIILLLDNGAVGAPSRRAHLT
jgi:hypothetical protein